MLRENAKKILPTTMLVFLVTCKCSITAVYFEVVDGIKYKLQHLHLEEYFIQQKQ